MSILCYTEQSMASLGLAERVSYFCPYLLLLVVAGMRKSRHLLPLLRLLAGSRHLSQQHVNGENLVS